MGVGVGGSVRQKFNETHEALLEFSKGGGLVGEVGELWIFSGTTQELIIINK